MHLEASILSAHLSRDSAHTADELPCCNVCFQICSRCCTVIQSFDRISETDRCRQPQLISQSRPVMLHPTEEQQLQLAEHAKACQVEGRLWAGLHADSRGPALTFEFMNSMMSMALTLTCGLV